MDRVGSPELLIIPFVIFFFAFIGAITIIPLWQICKKAGFSPALGILGIIPIANIFLMFFLAFADWPALKNLADQQNRS